MIWLNRLCHQIQMNNPSITLKSTLPRLLFRCFSSKPPPPKSTVAIFWDLDNRPPKSLPPYDAALRLRSAASTFGRLRFSLAYGSPTALSYSPPLLPRLRRKDAAALTNRPVAHLCRVCGRRFYVHERLLRHFRDIHQREQSKRIAQLESARGRRRVHLVGKFAMKMEKYERAAREVLVPGSGYRFQDSIEEAGFRVFADDALRDDVTDALDRGVAGCLVIVSDGPGFADLLREARGRRVRTVVVGDEKDGALKRCADYSFSWAEVVSGKARSDAVSVSRRWKDRDILQRLEWTHNRDIDSDIDLREYVVSEDSERGDGSPWWKLD
ncbi:hypothetical protein QJS10_CPB20g01532 [Acorus calamus]|uniref:C2H2-type domain-containing protein n=1 Tax=Acorus calamus TaxID=4465 RepID=A0AAV9C8R6_ACOCL|nr:hypothetical protein QJS10_CPB20g01532 [Acorus calamus]